MRWVDSTFFPMTRRLSACSCGPWFYRDRKCRCGSLEGITHEVIGTDKQTFGIPIEIETKGTEINFTDFSECRCFVRYLVSHLKD